MASETVMSYAEMLLAIVPAAAPTRKNQRATSCPAPISAKEPYFVGSRLIWTAFWWVSRRVDGISLPIPGFSGAFRASRSPYGVEVARADVKPSVASRGFRGGRPRGGACPAAVAWGTASDPHIDP